MTQPDNPTTIPLLPPASVTESDEVLSTSIADIVSKEPLDLSPEDIHRLIHALRAQRRNFATLDMEKNKGNVPKRARRLPGTPGAPPPAFAALDIRLDGLGEDQ